MDDLLGALFIAVVLFLLVVVLTAELVAEHTDAQVPKALLYGSTIRRTGRRTLLIEVPWVIGILGVAEFGVLLFLLHPESTISVRLVALAELLATGAWLVYLRGLISRRT